MIEVQLYGLTRLDTGLKKVSVEADMVNDIFVPLMEEIKKINPKSDVSEKDLKKCVIIVNNKQGNNRTKLKDGDVVMLLSPVCGG